MLQYDKDYQKKIIFKSYYQKSIFNFKLLNQITNYSELFIPYVKNQTSILVFNFFRYNYNLRDPIVLKIYFGSNPRKYLYKILSPNGVLLINSQTLKSINPSKLYDNLNIRVLHPYLRSINNEFRFFGIYNSSNKFLSVSHSQKKTNNKSHICGKRSFGLSNSSYSYFDGSNVQKLSFEKKSHFLTNKKLKFVPGFVCQDYNKNITGVWHDTSFSNKVLFKKSKNTDYKIYQVLLWPKPSKTGVKIFVDESQVGFLPDKIEVNVICLKNEKVIKKLKFLNIYNGSYVEINNINFTSECYLKIILVKFQSKILFPCLGYVQAIYTHNKSNGDEVHSMNTPSYKTDITKPNVSFRCRKFAPYIFRKEFKNNFYIINLDSKGKYCDNHFKLRVFGENNKEMVEDIYFKKKTGVFKINTKNINKFFIKNKLKNGILMIEAEQTNYSAIFTLSNNFSFGIDHFTGG